MNEKKRKRGFTNAVSDLSTIAYHRLLCGSTGQRDFGSLLLLLL